MRAIQPKTKGARPDMPVEELSSLLGVSAEWLVAACRYRGGRFFFLGARKTMSGWVVPVRSVERALKVAEVGLLLSVSEVAAIMGLEAAAVRRLVKMGTLPRVMIPGMDDIRVPARSVESLKEEGSALGMHSDAGARSPKAGGRSSGFVGAGATKRYYTADVSVEDQRITKVCGGPCGGRSGRWGRERKTRGGEGGAVPAPSQSVSMD